MSERTNPEQAQVRGNAMAVARPPRCPECGHDASDPSAAPVRSLFHWRTTAPAIAALLAMAIVAIIVWRQRETLMTSSGTPFAFALEPPITFADVKARAAGEIRSPSLLSAIRGEAEKRVMTSARLPGDVAIAVNFVDRGGKQRGLRRDTLSIGWPVGWWNQIEYTLYDDALGKSGFVAMRTRTDQDYSPVIMQESTVASNAALDESGLVWPRKRWSWGGYGSGNLAFRPPPEETGGRALWVDVNFFNVAAVLGLIALAWVIPSMLIWLANLVRGTKRTRWRGRLLKCACLAFAIGIVAWKSFDTVGRSDFYAPSFHPLQRGPARAELRDSTLRVSRLADLSHAADGEQQAAQAIIDAVNPLPQDDQCLAIAFHHDAVIGAGTTTYFCRSWPLLVMRATTYVERTDTTKSKRMANPAGTDWRFGPSSVSVGRSTGDPDVPEKYWSVNIGTLGTTLFGLFVIWTLTAMTCRFAALMIVRKRRRRNQCLACGHALGPAPANA